MPDHRISGLLSPTPLRGELVYLLFRSHPDWEFASFIAHGLIQGFRIGFSAPTPGTPSHGEELPVVHSQPNGSWHLHCFRAPGGIGPPTRISLMCPLQPNWTFSPCWPRGQWQDIPGGLLPVLCVPGWCCRPAGKDGTRITSTENWLKGHVSHHPSSPAGPSPTWYFMEGAPMWTDLSPSTSGLHPSCLRQ